MVRNILQIEFASHTHTAALFSELSSKSAVVSECTQKIERYSAAPHREVTIESKVLLISTRGFTH